jgi:chitinase
LHGSWDSTTGHHSGLYHRSVETDPIISSFNVDFALNYWINGGFPKEKINLGLALYGRTFKLANPSQHSLGSPAKGAGTAGTVSIFDSK